MYDDPLSMAVASMSEECPYCHTVYFAPAGYDPLKNHFDYCEAYPGDSSADD